VRRSSSSEDKLPQFGMSDNFSKPDEVEFQRSGLSTSMTDHDDRHDSRNSSASLRADCNIPANTADDGTSQKEQGKDSKPRSRSLCNVVLNKGDSALSVKRSSEGTSDESNENSAANLAIE
jgi:hypothetical protein